MPLKNYAVLKGRPIHNRLGTSGSPHYQVQVNTGEEDFRIAINVRSQDGSEVQYLVRSRFEHPVTADLEALEPGCHALQSRPGTPAIDFIRSNIAQPWEFIPLPMDAAGPDNDLNEKIDAYVQRAMADERAMVYAFGETWGPELKADRYFGFRPGRGIHDIHFNQGNPPGRFEASNGPYQDGCLLFEFPGEGASQWVGVFLKFQSQAWHTDDRGGTPAVPSDPERPDVPHTPVARDEIPTLDVPDGLVRIVAALVNDVSSPEREVVTLLNTADREVSLAGWAILDRTKRRQDLDGSIAAGATRAVELRKDVPAPVELSNRGGIITLINEQGIKVHGVTYTREQAMQPGRTVPFQT